MNQQVTIQKFQVSNGFYRIQANGRYACIHKVPAGWVCVMTNDATHFGNRYVAPDKLIFVDFKEAKQHGANYING